eukprot:7205551-Prymnesium_polylepis.1
MLIEGRRFEVVEMLSEPQPTKHSGEKGKKSSVAAGIGSEQVVAVQEVVGGESAIVPAAVINAVDRVGAGLRAALHEHAARPAVAHERKAIDHPANLRTRTIRINAHLLEQARGRAVVVVWMPVATTVLESVALDIGGRRGEIHTATILPAAVAAEDRDAIERDAHVAAHLRHVHRGSERGAVRGAIEARRRRDRHVPAAILSRVRVGPDADDDRVVVRTAGGGDAARRAGKVLGDRLRVRGAAAVERARITRRVAERRYQRQRSSDERESRHCVMSPMTGPPARCARHCCGVRCASRADSEFIISSSVHHIDRHPALTSLA